MTKQLLIMKTGVLPPRMAEKYGDYDMLYPHMADIPLGRADIVHVAGGEKPETPTRYCGVLVTGSESMVTDHAPWSEEAAQWLREAVSAGVPVLGICYGHQLLAHALGGTVEYFPDGMELGTVLLRRASGASGKGAPADHPWLKGLPGECGINVIHSQTVSSTAPGAQVLGRSQREPRQIVLFGPDAMGLQFHPEFDGEVMRDYLASLAENDPTMAGLCEPLMRVVRDTPESRSILQNFAADVLGRA